MTPPIKLTVIGLMLTVVAVFLVNLMFKPPSTLPELLHEVAVDPPQPLESIDLIDHHKVAVDLERFKGNWTFLFIGFSHCVHICVPTLSQMALLKKALLKKPALAKNLAFVFVSVDPKRDTPEHLAQYLRHFDPDFVGMSGDEAAVLDLEKRLKAFHRVREDKRKADGYDIDHSGEIFLIDPAARLTARFHPPLELSKVVQQFSLFVQHFTQEADE